MNSMETKKFDILIAGAGPAGCSTALSLAEKGYSIAVIDKAVFPREKICGGALSDRAINTILRMPGNIPNEFLNLQNKVSIEGVRISSPNGNILDLPIKYDTEYGNGFIFLRSNLDYFFYQQLKKYPNITVFEGKKIKRVETNDKKVVAQCQDIEFSGQVIAGCDGAYSRTARDLSTIKINPKHYCIGYRTYYQGIQGMHPDNFPELHFIKKITPGYLWIFPLPDGSCDVGIGAMASTLKKKNIYLDKLLVNILKTDTCFSWRFEKASQTGKLQSHGLPLGSRKLPLSGKRFVLAGDAASLIDPFTGEGIGNALLSGEIAAKHLINSFEKNDFSAQQLKLYDEKIYQRLGDELQLRYKMQHFLRFPLIYNFLIKKAVKNQSLKKLAQKVTLSNDIQKYLINPRSYLKLLFK
jgi:menaquinone-9 beta-reductase